MCVILNEIKCSNIEREKSRTKIKKHFFLMFVMEKSMANKSMINIQENRLDVL